MSRSTLRAVPSWSDCKGCGLTIPWLNTGRPPQWCDECRRKKDNDRARAWQRANPGIPSREPAARWAETLRLRYGLTITRWYEMLIAQSGRCWICETQMTDPHVDHNHETGQVRKLLCFVCNTRLGWYEQNRATVDAYLGGTLGV